jgi:hypothetical protein
MSACLIPSETCFGPRPDIRSNPLRKTTANATAIIKPIKPRVSIICDKPKPMASIIYDYHMRHAPSGKARDRGPKSVQVLARFQRPNYRKKMQQDQRRPRSRRVSGKVLQVIVIARHFRTLLHVEVRVRRVSATIGHNCSQLATTPRRHPLTIPLSLCRVWLASMLTARWRRVDDSSLSVAPLLAGWPVA